MTNQREGFLILEESLLETCTFPFLVCVYSWFRERHGIRNEAVGEVEMTMVLFFEGKDGKDFEVTSLGKTSAVLFNLALHEAIKDF